MTNPSATNIAASRQRLDAAVVQYEKLKQLECELKDLQKEAAKNVCLSALMVRLTEMIDGVASVSSSANEAAGQ